MKRSKPMVVLMLVTFLVSAVLVSCATPSDEDSSPSGDRTVKDQYGTVTIGETPTRIVTTGNVETDTLIALGIIPVAMGQWYDEPDGSSPWRREMLNGVQPEIISYSAEDGYSLEEILAMEPDLVLAGFDISENAYKQLSKVVPTISMPYETSAEDITRMIGKVMNREEVADTLIAQTAEQIAQTKQRYPYLEGIKLSIVDGSIPGELTQWTQSTIDLGMLKQLGLEPADGSADVQEYAPVSSELWSSVFNGDLMIVNFAREGTMGEFEKNKAFQQIPAVKSGNYLTIADRDEYELLRAAALPQVQYSLTHFIPKLAAAVN